MSAESPDTYADDLPGWPPSCPVCGIYEGRCVAVKGGEVVLPRRFTKRPHAGREGVAAYYPGLQPWPHQGQT